MNSVRVNPGRFVFTAPRGSRGEWKPQGKLVTTGRNPVVADRVEGATIAARLFVGFNVCDKPVYTMEDIVDKVQEIREGQGRDPDASFVYQRGLYKHHPHGDQKDCGLVEEQSAQVILIFVPEEYQSPPVETKAQFHQHMIDMAGQIARDWQQESVILEFQRNGVTEEVLFVKWRS